MRENLYKHTKIYYLDLKKKKIYIYIYKQHKHMDEFFTIFIIANRFLSSGQ